MLAQANSSREKKQGVLIKHYCFSHWQDRRQLYIEPKKVPNAQLATSRAVLFGF